LERTYDEIPRNDIKIILGNFNTKIGKEVMYRTAVGIHSRHETSNENGRRVADFTLGKNMRTSSTYFPHKNIHKETWICPDGGTRNQIDHVIIDTRHAKDITDVKTCRGTDCDSDHFLIRARLRQRLTTSKKASTGNKEIRYDNEALKEEGSRERYTQMISDGLKEHDLSEVDTEERWKI
jgi:hypothetical protein